MRCVDLHSYHGKVVGEIDSFPVARGNVERDKLLIFGKITLKNMKFFAIFSLLVKPTFVVMCRVSSTQTRGRWTGLWILREYWGSLPGSIDY